MLNTAIKILLWKIHCKTFKAICWYRYAYVARIPERRAFAKKYRAAKSQNERQRIRAAAVALPAKFIRGYDDIPNKSLPNYSIYKRGTKATDVDYDRIVFDTYDYLDKLISFKLSDIFYAIFSEYYKRTNDIRALKMAQYFKYGTDNENEIWMLRYGLSFEDIEILMPYIVSIGQEEIVFSARHSKSFTRADKTSQTLFINSIPYFETKVHRQGYRLLGTLAGGFFLLVLF